MVLAELSLAIAAVKGVGEAIDAAKSVAEVAGALDNALSLNDKIIKNNQSSKPKGATEKKIEKQLGKYSENTTGESTSLAAIVQEETDSIALRREIHALGLKLDSRWGNGTFDRILDIRKKRIAKQERLEYEHEQRLIAQAKARKKFWMEVLKGFALIGFLSLFAWFAFLNY